MQGIILAAGMGKRLKFLTNDHTKCMVEVNGVTMIERCLRILDKKNLSRIVIVVGYRGKELSEFIESLGIKTKIEFLDNDIYDKTNNIYSLALAKDYMCNEDTLLLESDLVFEESIIDELLNDERQNLALVDKFESWMDGTCMKLDEDDCITDFIPGKYLRFTEKDEYYKTVNIYKFSADFSKNTYIPFLMAYEKSMGENEYYETVIRLIAQLESREIRAKRLEGQVWYEIDNIHDLDIAESLFASSDEERYEKIISREGGYWRYPKLINFSKPVNPYYPSAKMLDEIKSNFEELLTGRPSNVESGTLCAASAFGIRMNHIVLGDGQDALIDSVLKKLSGGDQSYRTVTEDGSYNADDIISFYGGKEVNAFVLTNPGNPVGNFIDHEGVLKLIDWAKNRKIKLIIDETYVDFADLKDDEETGDLTLLKEEILELYDGLYVVKDIAECYGVSGARISVLASADEEMISYIKKDVVSKNINSFGEFFLQIKEKYDKNYFAALSEFRERRAEFTKKLGEIPYITPLKSQSNYIMCRLSGAGAKELATKLLSENILVADLTDKIGDGNQYIGLAIRSKKDNYRLIESLGKYGK